MRFTQVEAGGEWFDANVPCTQACPVLTNAGRYVAAIAALLANVAAFTGRVMVNLLPCPGALSTITSPPCACTMR